jgi:ATP-dependent RNA helicase DeaD
VIELKSDVKLDELINQLSVRSGSVLIFVKTKYGTEKLSKALAKNKIKSFPLHGGLRQSKRNTIMKNFRDMKFRILIATDVAARGIDVPHIEHVINYDLPQMAEDFIHRIGRTARAGSKGVALSFITKGDFSKWKEIQKILNPGKNIKNQSTSKTRNSKNSFNKKRVGNKRQTFKKRSDYKKSFSKNDEGSDKKSFSKKRFSKNNDQGKYKRSSDSESRTRKSFSKNDAGSDKKSFSKKRFSKNNDQGKYKRSSDSESRTRVSFSRNDGVSDKKTFSKKKFTNSKSKNSFNSNTNKEFSPRSKSGFSKKKPSNNKSNNFTKAGVPRKRRNK